MHYQRLKELRMDRCLKQKDIAAILCIDQSTYSKYETGKCHIPIRYISLLADYYNTSTDYILNITDIIEPYDNK